jgi:hypothetical protein
MTQQPPESIGDTDDQEPQEPQEPQERSGGWWFAVVPALTLLVGLVLGGVIVGVAGDGSQPPDDNGTASSPTSVGQSPSGDVAVVVPQECLEAAETVQQATELIRDGVGAIRDFRPDELITLLDELEDLDAQAREQAATCEQVDISRTP